MEFFHSFYDIHCDHGRIEIDPSCIVVVGGVTWHSTCVVHWFGHTMADRISVLTHWPKQNCRHFAIRLQHFQMHFLNENVWILIKISLKFFPSGPINNIPALVQSMAWHRHYLKQWWLVYWRICVTRPQWVYRVTPSIYHATSLEQMVVHIVLASHQYTCVLHWQHTHNHIAKIIDNFGKKRCHFVQAKISHTELIFWQTLWLPNYP